LDIEPDEELLATCIAAHRLRWTVERHAHRLGIDRKHPTRILIRFEFELNLIGSTTAIEAD
jgi:hypothetical protein